MATTTVMGSTTMKSATTISNLVLKTTPLATLSLTFTSKIKSTTRGTTPTDRYTSELVHQLKSKNSRIIPQNINM